MHAIAVHRLGLLTPEYAFIYTNTIMSVFPVAYKQASPASMRKSIGGSFATMRKVVPVAGDHRRKNCDFPVCKWPDTPSFHKTFHK